MSVFSPIYKANNLKEKWQIKKKKKKKTKIYT